MWVITLRPWVRTKAGQIAIASVLSTTAGAAAGYVRAKQVLEKKYALLSELEIAEAKKFYAALHKKDEYATPAAALEAEVGKDAVEALRNYQGLHVDPVVEKLEEVREEVEEIKNIFDEHDDPFDVDVEMELRSPDKPYIVTKDEHLGSDTEYPRVTFTYYEEDDVLTDEKDSPIPDTEGVVGNENLLRFGHGSGDHNIVYVRNERLELDIEILRSQGSFTKEVLGFIQHSDKRGPRKMRGYDE